MAPELDDVSLGRLLKSLRTTNKPGSVATADLRLAQIAQHLEEDSRDWDRRAHRLSVLAENLSNSALPSAWATSEPDCANALVLSAWSQLIRGRKEGGMANLPVTRDQCLRAADLDPLDPTPWVVLLGIARLAGYGQSYVFDTWNEVMARDRWHREAHFSMLGYLSPQEGGSHARVLDFLDSLRARIPANAPCAAVELTAHVLRYQAVLAKGGIDALMARNLWAQPLIVDALENAASTWLRPAFSHHAAALADLNLLAYSLIAADRRNEALPTFRALRGLVTSFPWRVEGDPLAEFERAQRKAVR